MFQKITRRWDRAALQGSVILIPLLKPRRPILQKTLKLPGVPSQRPSEGFHQAFIWTPHDPPFVEFLSNPFQRRGFRERRAATVTIPERPPAND